MPYRQQAPHGDSGTVTPLLKRVMLRQMTANVLLIEDDDRLAELLTTYLGGRGFSIARHPNGRAGMADLAARGTDVAMVLLDVMLPDIDGFDVCRAIRAGRDHPSVPIIMLTARGDAMDRIVGLELGADDYLPKPFNPRELLARMNAILRRQGAMANPSATAPEVRRHGRLTIHMGPREVRLNGEPRRLTAHQFELLCALADRPGRVMSRDQLMHTVRNTPLEAFDRSIDVHISRIRAAIEDDPKQPRRIQTIRGAGYVFAREQD